MITLEELIPDSSNRWVIKKNFLMYKKYDLVPIAFIGNDGILYIFLDYNIHKEVIRLIKFIRNKNVEFYLTTPKLLNPKNNVTNFDIISNYLLCYAQNEFFNGFKKIEFDLIDNMVKWCDKENCYDVIRECLNIVKKEVNRVYYDMHIERSKYPQEIIDTFNTLYREIQINKIL
jgi:hypothetical protein